MRVCCYFRYHHHHSSNPPPTTNVTTYYTYQYYFHHHYRFNDLSLSFQILYSFYFVTADNLLFFLHPLLSIPSKYTAEYVTTLEGEIERERHELLPVCMCISWATHFKYVKKHYCKHQNGTLRHSKPNAHAYTAAQLTWLKTSIFCNALQSFSNIKSPPMCSLESKEKKMFI